MKVILPVLPDPTDIVVQGWSPLAEMTFPPDPPVVDAPLAMIPIVAGEASYAQIKPDTVPSAMIGQHPWYGIMPRQIGPMRMAGGKIEMLAIGRQPRAFPSVDAVIIDPIQKWLTSVFMIDQAGFMVMIYDADVLGALEARNELMLPQPLFPPDPVVTIPRGAVFRSGLIKKSTAPVLPATFGRHTVIDSFTETTRKWYLSGVTRDASGTPMVSCRVVAMLTDKVVINIDNNANPVVANILSSASDGSYLIQVPNNNYYWLIGYKSGAPDLAGSTINLVIPVDG